MPSIKKNILIVDDDADIRVVIRKILEGSGYGVFEADSVSSALETSQSVVPHAILLDLVLGDEDGFAFLDKKREIVALQQIPVIVLSAKKDLTSVHKAVSLGASSYLVKPVVSVALLQRVKKALMERDSSFLAYSFPVRPKVLLQTNAVLTRMSHEHVCIELTIKLNTKDAVQIDSPLFKKVQFSSGMFKVLVPPRMPLLGGQYEVKLKYVGIRETVVDKIAQMVRFWK